MERDLLQVLNPQRLRSFEDWLETTSITLTQVNGQRKYGGPPPDWSGPAPGPGCEVFVTQIPRDVFEDCLIPLFQSVAPLYEFRLMMNFSGQNRGFAYAKYGRAADAEAAIRALHLYPLQDGAELVVKQSTEKRQLCLGELPAGMGEETLVTVLRVLSAGVKGVTVRAAGPRGKVSSALVLYSSHYAASMAKKVLVQAFKKQYGISISVRWFSGSSKPRHEEHDVEIPLPCTGPRPVSKAFLTPPCFRVSHCDPHPPPTSSPHPRLQIFSRAVGGPAPQAWNRMVPVSDEEAAAGDSVARLRRLCEQHGLGLPRYDVRYHHTSADGYLCFTYGVQVSGLSEPFWGAAQILPGSSTSATEDEARRTAAEQVLKALGHP